MDKNQLDKFFKSDEFKIWLDICHNKEYYGKEVENKVLNYNELQTESIRLFCSKTKRGTN